VSISIAKHPFHAIFEDLTSGASTTVSPRGEPTREVTDASVPFDTDADCWCNFPSRKLSINYICNEFLWYLRADPRDTSITKHAKIWEHLARRGALQSNYGVYLFRDRQFQRCFKELTNDPDSRRASCIILSPFHYEMVEKGLSQDLPCTYGLNFRIRRGELDMSVHMRSNDAWFGAGNDVPIFRWTQHMMAVSLGVPVGHYGHHVDSLHLYQRHWDAAEACLSEQPGPVIHPPIRKPLQMIEAMQLYAKPSPVDEFHEWVIENART